ncbi:MAG TPA: hypothetical protein PKX12_14840, partial [Spirochaetota bacterium]|nr:hypothetical protein [Spirochaetota bacterium]
SVNFTQKAEPVKPKLGECMVFGEKSFPFLSDIILERVKVFSWSSNISRYGPRRTCSVLETAEETGTAL